MGRSDRSGSLSKADRWFQARDEVSFKPLPCHTSLEGTAVRLWAIGQTYLMNEILPGKEPAPHLVWRTFRASLADGAPPFLRFT